MQPQNNPGTGGAPKIEVFVKPTPLGNWEFIAHVNGRFFSSSICRGKGNAKAHIKQDLKEKGYAMPAELIYL